ncbi:MAG: HlyD family efflux transporter periplasmic adaptor subunit [Parachlamydiales bacterium]|jgi:membrane fusion protein (multidrug efflux system)
MSTPDKQTTPPLSPPMPSSPAAPEIAPPGSNNKRNRTILWITLGFLVAAALWILLWVFYLRFHETTDDAYVNGYKINLTSAISGVPIAFYADDTDLVEEGQLLVKLDKTDYQLRYDNALANLGATVLQVKQLYETVKANATTVETMRVRVSKAKFDFENRKNLIESQAISNEDFVHTRDDLTVAELNLKYAEEQWELAKAAVGPTQPENHPLIEAQKSNVRSAYYNLFHTSIYAPARGYVAQRIVEVGQAVAPNSVLMAIIPENRMWVDANFKETQLKNMRIGQPVKVNFDLYGSGFDVEGNVIGIASGTGSVFSLIPPQNATGNWIKIVQRLPVRIGLNPEQIKSKPLRLGLSAYVDVNISDTDHPMLAVEPIKKAISTTKVYDIDFKVVEAKMQKIITANLMTN